MNVNGTCLCGELNYQAEVNPDLVFLCHCADCQTQSGSAFRTVVFAVPGSFRLLSGEMKRYVKTAESGRTRELTFCATCGTPVYGGAEGGESGPLSLRVGPLAQREELRPIAQLWCRSAQSWIEGMGDLPRNPTQP